LLAVALLTEAQPSVTSLVLAAATAAHAWQAREVSRVALASLALASGLLVVLAAGLVLGAPEVAFVMSILSIALIAGVVPFHAGVTSLAERAPMLQVRVFGTVMVLVWLHLRDLDHLPVAAQIAPALVRLSAVLTLVPALLALVARSAAELYRSVVAAHAGMLMMAVAAAGDGHYVAALFAALTIGLAMGGLGLVMSALSERTGPIGLTGYGGRVASFPALAACFALFGAAGVGLPGTVGFIADDLLLHAIWEESALGATMLIFASATLAVAILSGFSHIFLGPPSSTVAPDLLPRERRTLFGLLLLLVGLGVAPQVLVTPASIVLAGVP
jgi:NADH-quinone oxidoreductase subunit M